MTKDGMSERFRVIQGGGEGKISDADTDPYAHLLDRQAKETYESIARRYEGGVSSIPRGELSDFVRQRVELVKHESSM